MKPASIIGKLKSRRFKKKAGQCASKSPSLLDNRGEVLQPWYGDLNYIKQDVSQAVEWSLKKWSDT